MIIEVSESAAYDTAFQHVQFEITGVCNLKCKHCRAWMEPRTKLDVKSILEVVKFAASHRADTFYVTLSGGEPFMRRDLYEIVREVSAFDVSEIVITTNGWFGTSERMREIRTARKGPVTIQVSLDSVTEKSHDDFRGKQGSYARALKTVDLAIEHGLGTSLRMSVTPDRIAEMKPFTELAARHRVPRVAFGPVIPAGRAQKQCFLMDPSQKLAFHRVLVELRREYEGAIEVTTEDPLKIAVGAPEWADDLDPDQDGVFGGCTAGISTFNVGADGIITPCAVLSIAVGSVNGKTAVEIEEDYRESPVIRSLFARKFGGKCGSCGLRRVCGGCRAIPFGLGNSYLDEDPTCWM